MYEVEVKVRADLESVRRRLDEQGAAQVDAVVQTDVYYDAPHRDFAETDEALRVRREVDVGVDPTEVSATVVEAVAEGREASVRVTYKGPLVDADSKTREEVETGVDDGDAMDAILGHLGFDPAATVRKHRARFALAGYTVTLDRVDGLGEFVECEVESDADGVDEARDGAFAVLESLGLDPDDQIRTSYLGLLLAEQGE
ncbi:class IV adenylate cyclase [Haloarchaeobius sp. HRN-SO-5]|uniref:class IV adenylate cyclase n=1 Tax=Haloarchaeobius sp. HRN-SO-5 TaxID=3446118 RepID=UPI003EBC48F8